MPPPFRPPYACMSSLNQFVMSFNSMQQKKKTQATARHKFSAEEDQKLRELVAELGENDWSEVSNRLGTRSPRQCRERFKNYLAPNLKNDPWTEEEDLLLVEKQKEFGTKWSVIASFFPERSDVNIKNHWAQMTNRALKEHDIEQEKRQLVMDLETVIQSSRRACAPVEAKGIGGASDGGRSDGFGLDWDQDDDVGMIDFFDGIGF